MKRTLLFISLLVLFLMVTASCSQKQYINNQPTPIGSYLSQGFKTIELGENSTLLDYVIYQTDSFSVRVIDDGGFDINKVGEYVVTYRITQKSNNESEDVPFALSVVDTKAPTVSLTKDEIYISKGEQFEIANYITYADASGDCKVQCIGEVDMQIADTYIIQVKVTDQTGNASISSDLRVIVENRDDTVFRNVKFGETFEEVERHETLPIYDQKSNYLLYLDAFAGVDCIIYYNFNNAGQLCNIMLTSNDSHYEGNEYLVDFESIMAALEKSYGEAASDEESYGSLGKYIDTKGQALLLEQYARQARWSCDGFNIVLTVYHDGQDVILGFVISSTEYCQEES